MRLRSCKTFLEKTIPSRDVKLNDSRLVIDGQNFFYETYKESNLNDQFGCECDKYAEFLREKLSMFQQANVTCYFLFKGGHDGSPNVSTQPSSAEKSFENTREPLLAREVYKQLLDEMDFDYTVVEGYVNKYCVALAQTLKCPILANNVKYFFHGVQYIPYTTLYSNLRGRMFELDSLMTKYNVNKKQVATFLALFDSNVFSTEILEQLLQKLRLPLSYARRIHSFLRWLAREGEGASTSISRNLPRDEYLELQSNINRILATMIGNREPGGLPAQYFLDKDRCKINDADPDWFAKGIVLKFIPIPYIDMCKWQIIIGEWFAVDDNDEDSFLLVTPIVRYAFDLLTNFNSKELVFKKKQRELQVSEGESDAKAHIKIIQTVRKPNYVPGNVFENGWDDVDSFELFEYFLSETLQISDLGRLERAPSDARLLIISLVYLSRQRADDASVAAPAALLCYALLAKPPAVALHDRNSAVKLMDEYSVSEKEDRSVRHPLAQFQHCLRHINFLNTLCGSPFPPTIYSKTFNATFVYKVLYIIKRKFGGDARRFLEHELQPFPTVLSFLHCIVDLYNEMKYPVIR